MQSPSPFRSLPAALLILTFAALPSSAAELSFAEALRRAGIANENALAARAETEGRRHELRAADRLAWPKLDLNAKTVRIDGPVTIDLSPIRSTLVALHPQAAPLIPPFALTVQSQTFQRVTVAFSEPLYTGGKINAARAAARGRVAEAEALERAAAGAITTEIASRYFGVALAERVASVQRDVARALEEHVRHARRLEEEGMIAKAERLNAEVGLAEARRALVKAEGDAALAREALASTLAADRVDEPLSTPLFMLAELPPELLEPDLARNPSLLRAATLREQAAAATAAEAASRRPTIALAANRELNESDLTLLDPSWSVGLGLSLSLFDGGRAPRIAAARSREERAALLAGKTRRDLTTLHASRVIALRNAQEQFRAATAALDLARENVRVRSRAFEEGFATSLDVVDARLSLARVETARLAAASDFDNALAQLLEVRGESERFEELLARGETRWQEREVPESSR